MLFDIGRRKKKCKVRNEGCQIKDIFSYALRRDPRDLFTPNQRVGAPQRAGGQCHVRPAEALRLSE